MWCDTFPATTGTRQHLPLINYHFLYQLFWEWQKVHLSRCQNSTNLALWWYFSVNQHVPHPQPQLAILRIGPVVIHSNSWQGCALLVITRWRYASFQYHVAEQHFKQKNEQSFGFVRIEHNMNVKFSDVREADGNAVMFSWRFVMRILASEGGVEHVLLWLRLMFDFPISACVHWVQIIQFPVCLYRQLSSYG